MKKIEKLFDDHSEAILVFLAMSLGHHATLLVYDIGNQFYNVSMIIGLSFIVAIDAIGIRNKRRKAKNDE